MTDSRPTPKPSSDRIPWLTVTLLTAAAFVSFLSSTVVMIITPKLMLMLGVGTYRVAWVSSIYMIASGMITPISGYLGDRLGMKRLFLLCLGVFVLGSLLCGLASDINTLLAARVIQALGGGLLMPTSNAIILRVVPPNRLGSAMGVRGIAVSAAPALGPLLGAYLTDRLGWHAIFLMNVPLGIIVMLLVYFLVPKIKGYPEPKMDSVGFFLSSVMLFTGLLGVSEGQKAGWTSEYIVTLFTISFFFALLFVIWELSVDHPMLDLRLLKNMYFTVSMFIAVATTVGMYCATYFAPLFAESSLHFTLIKTGLLLCPAGITMGLMALIAGRLFDRMGALPLVLGGLALAGLVTIRMAYLTTDVSFSSLMWLLVWRSVGLGVAMFPLTIGALYTVPRRLAGRATALNSIARMVPASFGLAYFTFILNRQEVVHYVSSAARINVFSAASYLTLARLKPLGRMAVQALAELVQAQAMARSMDDIFFISSILLLCALPFTFLLSKGRMEKARAAEEARMAKQEMSA